MDNMTDPDHCYGQIKPIPQNGHTIESNTNNVLKGLVTHESIYSTHYKLVIWLLIIVL